MRDRPGQAAEREAMHYLQAQGLVLVARNWRCKGGELDLVMQEADVLVFIEVRYRSSMAFGGALASLTAEKCRRLQWAAQCFLLERRGAEPCCRFDAVLSQGHSPLRWIKNILS